MHLNSIPCYVCPLCNTALNAAAKRFACQNNHHFDLAKEGYLNLLPVQFKHSAEPGDNKQMIQARREFLEAGFYEPLAKAVVDIINVKQIKHLLDVGCGEGYYSRKIEAYCRHNLMLHGIDIAKVAIAAAAKKQPNARFIVASANRLPYAEHYFDGVLNIFAPAKLDELKRILKPSGFLLSVTPGPRHLWQLKEFIYTEVREHRLTAKPAQGFDYIDSQRICYKITPTPQQRITLLHMTPFAWRANEIVQQTIKEAVEPEIEIDFMLTLLQTQPTT